MLPKLKILALNDLPKLETICNGEIVFFWPALQDLHVWDCPNLKKLPLAPSSAPNMRKVRGQLAWFEDLQLKDEYAKIHLQPSSLKSKHPKSVFFFISEILCHELCTLDNCPPKIQEMFLLAGNDIVARLEALLFNKDLVDRFSFYH